MRLSNTETRLPIERKGYRNAKQILFRSKIYPNVTRIAGMGGELCYLVEGSERALLIDGLSGVGSLRAFVRELTELPVTLVITHGHVDHAPAIYEYGEGFIHPDDIALMYSPLHSSMERRLGFALGGKMMGGLRTEPTMADVIPTTPVKTYPVYDGDIFDLGGTQIEVVHVPGHTYGSIALIDKDNRACYTGDCCNMNTLLFLLGSTTIEEYKESLLHLRKNSPSSTSAGAATARLPSRTPSSTRGSPSVTKS